MQTESRPVVQKRPSFIEEARRAQIIEAATQTVAELGYANASLARIAERAGVSKSVISYHFDGKEDLLLSMVGQFFEDAWEFMRVRIEAATTPADKLRAWIGSELLFFGADRTGFLAMIEVVTGYRPPDGSRPFAEGEQQELDALAELLEAGQRAGEFRDFDPRSVATIIVRAAEGVLGTWATNPDAELEAEGAALLDFIDHAVRKDRP